jgi:hypothetical protein
VETVMSKKRRGFKTSPSIRLPRATAQKMHAAAAAEVVSLRETLAKIAKVHRIRFEECERQLAERDAEFCLQAKSHANDVTALTLRSEMLHGSLLSALRLLRSLRNNEWTPADDQILDRIQKVAGVDWLQ